MTCSSLPFAGSGIKTGGFCFSYYIGRLIDSVRSACSNFIHLNFPSTIISMSLFHDSRISFCCPILDSKPLEERPPSGSHFAYSLPSFLPPSRILLLSGGRCQKRRADSACHFLSSSSYVFSTVHEFYFQPFAAQHGTCDKRTRRKRKYAHGSDDHTAQARACASLFVDFLSGLGLGLGTVGLGVLVGGG